MAGTRVLGIRLSDEERAAADAVAESLGMTTADFARKCLVSGTRSGSVEVQRPGAPATAKVHRHAAVKRNSSGVPVCECGALEVRHGQWRVIN